MTQPTLEARGISVHYGGVKAVDGVDIGLAGAEILGLIGPNGAGKSTLVNAITHVVRRAGGSVHVDGRNVTKRKTAALARTGVIRTFQNPRLFTRMTVVENVEVAALAIGRSPAFARRRAEELLMRVGLFDMAQRRAGSLAYGNERLLSIARALAGEPRFLLLDEPAAGLSDVETDELIRVIADIRDDLGCAVMVIEHDMRLIMRLCDRIHVLDHGKTLTVGTPAEVRSDARVIEAYLGS